jgi:hypothetical protein
MFSPDNTREGYFHQYPQINQDPDLGLWANQNTSILDQESALSSLEIIEKGKCRSNETRQLHFITTILSIPVYNNLLFVNLLLTAGDVIRNVIINRTAIVT